jgi:hypothetical protein
MTQQSANSNLSHVPQYGTGRFSPQGSQLPLLYCGRVGQVQGPPSSSLLLTPWPPNCTGLLWTVSPNKCMRRS